MRTYNIQYDTTSVWQSVSGGWTNDAYRQITLEKPATGELKTWLEANAVRLPLIGTYVFKNAPTAPSLDVDSREISSSTNISILFPDYTGAEPLLLTRIEASSDGTIGFEAYIDGEPNLVSAYSNGTWEDSSLRTITFTQPVQYQGNEAFVRWFVDNVTPPSIIEKGTYVFKDGLSSGPWKKGSSVTQRIFAKSNNTDVSSITLLVGAERTLDGLGGFNIEKISYDLNVGGMTKTTQVYFGYVWTSAAYKTIEITEDCIVDEQFKKWFDYYTTKQ